MRAIFTSLFVFGFFAILFGQNVASVTPDNAYQGESLQVTIMGQDPFSASSGSSTFAYGYFSQGSTTLVGSGTLTDPSTVNLSLFVYQFAEIGDYDLDLELYAGSSTVYDFSSAIFHVNPNLGGSGTIGGNIAQGSNKADTGDPVNGLRLHLLSSSGDTLIITRTDASGGFSFRYLPDGTYYLHGDGLNNTAPLEYIIGGNNVSYTGLYLLVQDNKLVTNLEEAVLLNGTFALAPNTLNGASRLMFSLKQQAKVDLNVYTIDGRKVTGMKLESMSSGDHVIILDESKLTETGYYLFELLIDGKSYTQKGIKL